MKRALTAALCCAAACAFAGCGGSDAGHSACVRARSAESAYKLAAARLGLKFGQTAYETPLFASIATFRNALAEVGKAKGGAVKEEMAQIAETLSRQEALLQALRAHDKKTVQLVSQNLNTNLREALIRVEVICPSTK